MELVEWIKEQIFLKNLLPGQKIYSENELKELFGVSRQTVRHAIEVLEREDIVRSVKGSGTYINDSRFSVDRKHSKVMLITICEDVHILQQILQGMEHVLSEHGYTVQIACTNNQYDKERTILEDIIHHDEVAGIIIEMTKSGIPSPNFHLYEKICKRRIPILFLNSYCSTLKIPHVSINNRLAGKNAAKHLIEMGHQRIGGIFKLDDIQGHQRYAGYLDAMYEAGLEIDDNRILWLDTMDVRNLSKSMQLILERIENCTGVFCYNAQIARELMELLKEQEILIPEDLSVVAVDDSDLVMEDDRTLSAIPYPIEKLGEKVAQNLIKMMKNPAFNGTYEFENEIVIRDSVKRFQKSVEIE